jgi:cation transport ATPase
MWLLYAAILGIIPAMIASSKGRSPVAWWFYGTALFIIALPHALLLSPTKTASETRATSQGMKKCPYCAEMIQGEAIVCRYCGRDLVA